MSQSATSLLMDTAYKAAISTIWTTLVNELRKIEGIVVNDEVLTRLNSWPENGPNWPQLGNRYSTVTGNLMSYKGQSFTMALSLSSGWQYCSIQFSPCSTYTLSETIDWLGSEDGYGSRLIPGLEVNESNITTEERKGVQFTKEQAISEYAHRAEKRHNNKIGWYVHSDNLDWLIEKMDKCVAMIEKCNKPYDQTKQETIIYNRYLKNRWPAVQAYLVNQKMATKAEQVTKRVKL